MAFDGEARERVEFLVVEHAGIVDFGGPEHGASDELIAAREAQLGFSLPESYKWFCRRFGGGEVAGEEIFSLYDVPWAHIGGGGDIVFQHLEVERLDDRDRVVVCDLGDRIFFFDTSSGLADGEYDILCLDLARSLVRPVAGDFAEFLEKLIREITGNVDR